MDTHAASKIIMIEIKKARGSKGITDLGAKDNFCSIWPRAKPILELLSGIAILIPGAGATAGAVSKGLIAIGDKISEETCA